jgi:hypothetical protein
MAEKFKSLTKTLKFKMKDNPEQNNFKDYLGDFEENDELYLQNIRGSEVLKTGINILPFHHPENRGNRKDHGGLRELRRKLEIKEFKEDLSNKKSKKSKRGGKQYAMRKGTTKMIDELKHFEGFSQIANRLDKNGNDAKDSENQKSDKKSKKTENNFEQTLLNINKEIQTKIAQQKEEKQVKSPKGKSLTNDTIDNETKSEKQRKLDKLVAKNVEDGGVANIMKDGIEQSIDFEHENEKDKDSDEFQSVEENQILIKPDIIQKLKKSSLFNLKGIKRDYDFSDDELVEKAQVSKAIPKESDKPIVNDSLEKKANEEQMKISSESKKKESPSNSCQKDKPQETLEKGEIDKNKEHCKPIDKIISKTEEDQKAIENVSKNVNENPPNEKVIKDENLEASKLSNILKDIRSEIVKQEDQDEINNVDDNNNSYNEYLGKRNNMFDESKMKDCLSIESDSNNNHHLNLIRKKGKFQLFVEFFY